MKVMLAQHRNMMIVLDSSAVTICLRRGSGRMSKDGLDWPLGTNKVI